MHFDVFDLRVAQLRVLLKGVGHRAFETGGGGCAGAVAGRSPWGEGPSWLTGPHLLAPDAVHDQQDAGGVTVITPSISPP